MPFFDSITKKASEATARAAQKAQEFSETAKLNSMISDAEKQINNTYYQIGKLYVSIHGADGEEAFAGMVATIADAEQKIIDYRSQIQNIKGVQRCEKCGAEVQRGTAFCSACGAAMPKIETITSKDVVQCENCGAMVKADMRFCTSCGKPMVKPQSADQIERAMPESVPDTPTVGTKLCPHCNAVVSGEVVFCTECGGKLE